MKKITFLLPIMLLAMVSCKAKITKNKNMEYKETKEKIIIENKKETNNSNLEIPPHYNLEDLPINKNKYSE